MFIRTKIVATLGPASSGAGVIRSLVQAGADVFRVNFSHGAVEQHAQTLAAIRQVEKELTHPIAILGDLCGPKIRVGNITGGSVLLADGQKLVIQRKPIEGQADRISITLGELIDAAQPGHAVLLDDGKIRLEISEVRPPDEILCRVVTGGVLASGKGVNLPHTPIKLSALTEKDLRDAAWLAKTGEFDYVGLSFVRAAEDVETLRNVLKQHGCPAHIVAKIEKPQALEHLDEIVAAADAVMVARGDLGVEMDLPAVPVAQKQIARICQSAGKPCIIATQMLESMTTSPTPTRAEVSDVANAVLDHADAVMLSGETAVGKFPVQAVKMMNRIVEEIQGYHDDVYCAPPVPKADHAVDAVLAGAVRQITAGDDVAAAAVFTMTGRTALLLAKHRLPCPVLGLTPHADALRRMALYYGVLPVLSPMVEHTSQILDIASQTAIDNDLARPGQKLVVLSGRPIGRPVATNTLVIHTIPGEQARQG